MYPVDARGMIFLKYLTQWSTVRRSVIQTEHTIIDNSKDFYLFLGLLASLSRKIILIWNCKVWLLVLGSFIASSSAYYRGGSRNRERWGGGALQISILRRGGGRNED